MRCVNCTISCRYLRRRSVVALSQELQEKLARWLPIQIPFEEAIICLPCHNLLTLEENRTLGHDMVCISCGKSARSLRHHFIEDDNHLLIQEFAPNLLGIIRGITRFLMCHSCWVTRNWAVRQAEAIPAPLLPPSEPTPRDVEYNMITLPNYKRTANTSRHCVFQNCMNQIGHRVPNFIKKLLLGNHKLYIPDSARVCDTHLLENNWEQLVGNVTYNNFSSNQVEDIIQLSKSSFEVFNFEGVNDMPNHVCHYWTSLTVDEFNNLFNSLPPLNLRKPKMALALFLAKLRTGESNRRLANVFNISKSTLIMYLKRVRDHLYENLVPRHLGVQHITHRQIAERNLTLPNALFGNPEAPIEERRGIIIFDGTYAFLQKSSNYLFQKMTYSLHKYDNLVKPFVMVSTDGHIIDVVGPYAATKTDADIMIELFENENSPYRQLFSENDVFILDKGFRDAIPLLHQLNYQVHKPETPLASNFQYTTEQANRTRCVTLCRWVVEVVNGRFKRDFKLFRQRFFNLAANHLIIDYKIAAALLNKFHPLIEDSPYVDDIINRVARYRHHPNHLCQIVNEQNLNQRRTIFQRIDGNLPQMASFPVFQYSELIIFALGPYQVRQARSYYGEHIRQNGLYEVEICPDPERTIDLSQFGGNQPFLLRGRIRSRHTSRKIYFTYIIFDAEPIAQNPLDNILGHYCNCMCGSRTIGCCSHVMTLIWYLGWARHQEGGINPPASFLDNILLSLNDY